MAPVIVGVVALIVGVAAGFLIRTNIARTNANSLEAQARQKLVQADQRSVQAEQEAAQTLRKALEDAKGDAGQIRREAEEDVKARRDEIARLERRIAETEDELRGRTAKLDLRSAELDERDEKLQREKAQRIEPIVDKVMARKPAEDQPPLPADDYAFPAIPRGMADRFGNDQFHQMLDTFAEQSALGPSGIEGLLNQR